MDDKDIKKLREKINNINDSILKLYEERMDICQAIGDYKKEKGLPVYDPDREDEVLETMLSKVSNPRYRDGAAQLFITLMQVSCELQEGLIDIDPFSEEGFDDLELDDEFDEELSGIDFRSIKIDGIDMGE